jgi:hypothetical protein
MPVALIETVVEATGRVAYPYGKNAICGSGRYGTVSSR